MATKSESSIVSKCGIVLDIVTAARSPLDLKDIVNQSGLAKSSAHRILTILINEKLIDYDKANRHYSYGTRLNQWARSAWLRNDLHGNSVAEMEKIAHATKMNSVLSVLDGDSILYLRTLNTFPVNHTSHPGDHAPLHCTAAGKVFLAFQPSKTRDDTLARLKYERQTEHSIQDSATLLKELAITREREYGLALQEEFLPALGMAAPIKDLNGDVIACLSLWTVADRNSQAELEALAPRLIASANRISKQPEEA